MRATRCSSVGGPVARCQPGCGDSGRWSGRRGRTGLWIASQSPLAEQLPLVVSGLRPLWTAPTRAWAQATTKLAETPVEPPRQPVGGRPILLRLGMRMMLTATLLVTNVGALTEQSPALASLPLGWQ